QRMGRAVECANSFSQIHKATAFRVERATGRGEIPDRTDHRVVGGQLGRCGFGIAAAEIEPVDGRELLIVDWAEAHQLRAQRFEAAEVILVIKVKRLVIGYAKAAATRGNGG